jgi:hypothetical protein
MAGESQVTARVFDEFISRLRSDSDFDQKLVQRLEELLRKGSLKADQIKAAVVHEDTIP